MTQPSTPRPVIAGPAVRLAALVYDGLLVLALMVFVGAILIVIGTSSQTVADGQAGKLSDAYRYGVIFPAFVLVTWWFYGLFWKRTGQTLGMQTWRLKTIRPDGHLLNWRESMIRCASACVIPLICCLMTYVIQHTAEALTMSFIVGFLFNYLFALANDRRLAIHDILSRTVTVRMPLDAERSWVERIKTRLGQR